MSAVQLVEFRFGRNLWPSNVPMSAELWSDFRRGARVRMEMAAEMLQAESVEKLEQWVEVHTTDAGSYKGTTEEAAVVTLYTNGDLENLFDYFVQQAGHLAAFFRQDTVAVVWQGVGHLVGADGQVR